MVDLQEFDLVPYHLIASVLGVIIAVLLIKLSTHNKVHTHDKLCFKWAARISYALIGASMGWSAMFGLHQDWQPWPPFLLLCIAIDLRMAASVLAAYFKNPARAG